MVLAPEPVFARGRGGRPAPPAVPARPGRPPLRPGRGRASWPAADGFSLLCGRYEGVDQRVADHLVDGELSIGDFVLAGGEVAALVVVEAVARLVPGVMGNDASAEEESFADGLLEYPQYTRPADFRGWAVPEVLRSGDHGRVARWRRAQALARTRAPPARPARPARGGLTDEEPRLLEEWGLGSVPPASGAAGAAGADPLSWAVPRHRCEEHRAMNPTDLVDRSSLRDDVPDFAPGRHPQGARPGGRGQPRAGPGLPGRGDPPPGLRASARRSRCARSASASASSAPFPVHSPVIAKIEVVTRGDVRRAKLYYLRDRTGKAAKIKEKRTVR